MLVKALISFCGKENMRKGEVREISDLAIAQDLLRAGYIEAVEPEVKPEKKPAKPAKTKAKKTPKGE